MTTKGTFTLPVEVRRDMGLGEDGEVLVLVYDHTTKQAVLSKPQSLENVRSRLKKYAERKEPLKDVSGFYRTDRGGKGE